MIEKLERYQIKVEKRTLEESGYKKEETVQQAESRRFKMGYPKVQQKEENVISFVQGRKREGIGGASLKVVKRRVQGETELVLAVAWSVYFSATTGAEVSAGADVAGVLEDFQNPQPVEVEGSAGAGAGSSTLASSTTGVVESTDLSAASWALRVYERDKWRRKSENKSERWE